MLKKIALSSVGFALLASPLLVSAQSIADLQAQIQALLAQITILQAQSTTPPQLQPTGQPDDYGTGTTQAGVYCPKLATTLQKGSRDASTRNQVSELQAFLTDYYNLDENIVTGGFFGNLTHKYLVQFQQEQGLPTIGIVGPLTRAKIARVCGGGTSTPIPTPVVTPVTTPASLQNFVPGHNKVSADRINLVLVGINFSSTAEFTAEVAEMLGWDGVPTRGGTGFGPFAIEPLRSNKNKFNVWYDPSIITAGTSNATAESEINAQIQSRKAIIANLNLPYVVPVFLNKIGSGVNTYIVSHAEGQGITMVNNSFSSLTKANLTPRAVLVSVDGGPTQPSQLAHELGHGIFGLADEKTDGGYDVAGTPPRLRAPSCVATLAEAQSLWGSMVGQIDPFYTEWKQTLQQNGQWNVLFPADVHVWRTMDEGMRVGYYYGQCYGDRNGRNVIRPTDFSIMHQSQVAVFGLVNRRQVETVLSFFSGTGSPIPTVTKTPTTTTPDIVPLVPTGTLTTTNCTVPAGATTCTFSTIWTTTGAIGGIRLVFTPQGGSAFNMLNDRSPANYSLSTPYWSAGTHTVQLFDTRTNTHLDSKQVLITSATTTLAPTCTMINRDSTSPGYATLTWVTRNATSIQLSPNGLPATANVAYGSHSVMIPRTGKTTYTLTVSNASGTSTCSVDVGPLPVVATTTTTYI